MTSDAVLVLGLGMSGRSVVRHLYESRHLILSDTRYESPQISSVLQCLKDRYPEVELVAPEDIDRVIGRVDTVVPSPGLPLHNRLLRQILDQDVPISGELDLFMDAADADVYVVTGTNGKSTVTSLAGQMLRSCNVRVGGNLGTPALDLLDSSAAGYLLELSSFQLEKSQPHHFAVSALLNVEPDHLDHHLSLAHYFESKRAVYRDCDFAVYNGDDVRTHPPLDIPGIAVGTDARWCATEEGLIVDGQHITSVGDGLIGSHNRFNAVVAAALSLHVGASFEDITQAVGSFEGLKHRMQHVGCIGGVTYINDSKATNVGATIAAVNGVPGSAKNIVLLVGGDGKGSDFESLGEACIERVKYAILFGRDASLVEQAMLSRVPTACVADLNSAVSTAKEIAASGDVVLLSPACASFDQFDDYMARGDCFAECVAELRT